MQLLQPRDDGALSQCRAEAEGAPLGHGRHGACSIDINSCRWNALLVAPLPSLDFKDEPEPYDPQRFEEHDFYWVDNEVELEMEGCSCGRRDACKCVRTGLPFKRLHSLPYHGAGLTPCRREALT